MTGSKNPQTIAILLFTKSYDAVIFNSAYNLYLMLNQFFGNWNLEMQALHHQNFSLPLYVFFVVTFNVNDPDDEDDEEEVALSLTLTSSNASPQNLSGVESKQLYV